MTAMMAWAPRIPLVIFHADIIRSLFLTVEVI
jgi:hypothetical protein